MSDTIRYNSQNIDFDNVHSEDEQFWCKHSDVKKLEQTIEANSKTLEKAGDRIAELLCKNVDLNTIVVLKDKEIQELREGIEGLYKYVSHDRGCQKWGESFFRKRKIIGDEKCTCGLQEVCSHDYMEVRTMPISKDNPNHKDISTVDKRTSSVSKDWSIWCPCSDKLPEYETTVQIYSKDCGVQKGERILEVGGEAWNWFVDDKMTNIDVVKWRPIK